MVLSTFLTQLLLYSFIGDYLKSQMEEVGYTIYQSVWYDFPVKLMRNVIFVLMRTQSPIVLRAGNFVVVNLSTYMSILKTSASYLSVLRVMIEIWNTTYTNEEIFIYLWTYNFAVFNNTQEDI